MTNLPSYPDVKISEIDKISLNDIPGAQTIALDGIGGVILFVFVGALFLQRLNPVLNFAKGILPDDFKLFGKRKSSDIDELRAEIEALRMERSIPLDIPALPEVVEVAKPDELTLAKIRQIEREAIRGFIESFPPDEFLGFSKELMIELNEPVMLEVTPYYANFYMDSPAESYRGKSDAAIWGEQIAAVFRRKDMTVFRKHGHFNVDEAIASSLSGVTGKYVGQKWHYTTPHGVILLVSFGQHKDELR